MRTIVILLTGLASLATAQPPRYTVIDLGTLAGGNNSYAPHNTNSGWISGHASPADGTWHAVVWQKSAMTDISQFAVPELRGLNSVAFGINDRGQATGNAESSIPDPNGEDFCGFKALGLPSLGHTCLPFVWQNGAMTPLPTLGGPNGSTNQINNRGEVVGNAETLKHDPGCPPPPPGLAPQLLQFKPVLWTNGKVQELPPFPGDLDGIALGINDSGQAVGASGPCSVFNPQLEFYFQPTHALLWQNGQATDLKGFGGSGQFGGNIALAINNQGQVVGNSDLPGDTTFHAFVWSKETGIRDLPPFAGDFASVSLGINDRSEVVGGSLDGDFNLRAVLWENGVPFDLNSLVTGKPGMYLQLAESINARGEIVGFGQTSTGEMHGFLATPRPGANAVASSAGAQTATRPLALSESGRKMLQQRMRSRFLDRRGK